MYIYIPTPNPLTTLTTVYQAFPNKLELGKRLLCSWFKFNCALLKDVFDYVLKKQQQRMHYLYQNKMHSNCIYKAQTKYISKHASKSCTVRAYELRI